MSTKDKCAQFEYTPKILSAISNLPLLSGLQQEPSWDIDSIPGHSRILTQEEREKYWSSTHVDDKYDSVWSITEDTAVTQRIIDHLNSTKAQVVLIPGCGSRTFLQERIIAEVPTLTRIISTDFKQVIEQSSQSLALSLDLTVVSPSVEFLSADLSSLLSKYPELENTVDSVIVVNSVVSEKHSENVDMLTQFYSCLKPGGSLIGYFPNIHCAVDLLTTTGTKENLFNVNLPKSSCYEPTQGIHQIFYNPLRLRKVLLDIGYSSLDFRTHFFDSPYFIKHSKEYYGLSDPDAVIYENFVTAVKQ